MKRKKNLVIIPTAALPASGNKGIFSALKRYPLIFNKGRINILRFKIVV
jgi:hypothetical protein